MFISTAKNAQANWSAINPVLSPASVWRTSKGNKLRQLGFGCTRFDGLSRPLKALKHAPGHVGRIQSSTRIDHDNVPSRTRLIVQHTAKHGHGLLRCIDF
jgi:hypothetical protein